MVQVSLKYNKIPANIPRNSGPGSKNIGYDSKKIWSEYQLINRMIYRSQNQHKASFSFNHLKEVKRLGERIGKLELFLKANYAENGEKLFDFLGYLNTFRLLIDKAIEACRKTFYYYCHYLDQALFVTLALVVIGSISTLHSELMQWAKYIRLLYNSGIDKLKSSVDEGSFNLWLIENRLEEKLKELVKCEELKPSKKTETPIQIQSHSQQMIPSKNKPAGPFKKHVKKTKTNESNNEIDDIFGGIDEFFDWILKRKRCPFCVAPFPILKCVDFELLQCPKCETEFCLDEENDLEPVFNEKYYKTDGVKSHFPKSTSISSHNILCSNCTENQQKIVQLLQSFDTNSSTFSHRKQYELYANKLESRYPLCATCSYRVSVHLKKCEDEASLEERRHTALSGGDWQNKLKLAEKMKWKQMKRKLIKEIFFWPDFLFQIVLTVKCVLKDFKFVECDNNFNIYGDLNIWLPSKQNFNDLGSFYFVICSILFFIQFNGIALNSRNPFELVPQLFIFASRLIIGNFLYKKHEGIEMNIILTLAAVGLAIIFKTRSRNALRTNRITFINQSRPDEIIFSKSSPLKESVKTQSKRHNYNKLGFAGYSEKHHQFHSFANQVAPDVAKPIMPWAEKPLPGKLIEARVFNFNENLLYNNNNSGSGYKMKPSKLVSDDPLELEPMFSSFSLSDEPKVTRRSTLRSNNKPSITNNTNIVNNLNNNQSIINNLNNNNDSLLNPLTDLPKISIAIVYNSFLTLILAAFRVTLMHQTSLVSIIIALTFGLRGFIWPRLSLKVQLITLTVAVARLAWLGVVLNGKIEQKFEYFALVLDLILIILR